jgi:hypothetical protein
MVLSRGDSPSAGDARLSLGSLAEVAETLRAARRELGLSPVDAASAAGVDTSDVLALESGEGDRLLNRIETLHAIRAYADSLGLSGGEYVVALIDLWPALEHIASRGSDVTTPPLVSVSGAPAGTWSVESTGVPDSTITGVFAPVVALGMYDTGTFPAVETGETPAVGSPSLFLLKASIAITAFLVALGSVALAERSHVVGWYDSAQHATSRALHAAFGSGAPAKPARTAARAPAKKPPSIITYVNSPATNSVAVNVRATSFTVKMVAYGYPCWVQVTDPVHHNTVFAQTLRGGETHVFTVTSPLDIETASSAGRAYVYEGNKFIGFYFPTKTPFFLDFRATP